MAIPKQIKEIIDSIFSDSGYNIQKFNLKFPSTLDISLSKKENTINLSFYKELPKITWKQFITLSARVQGIVLNDTGGILKLRYFPDIPFSYNQSEERFGIMYDLSFINSEIESEYPDAERRLVAKKCLQYANEWATIASEGTGLRRLSYSAQKKLKRDCKNFVIENIKNDPEINAGSIILSFLFFYVVIPTILRFVLERVFKQVFD